jgi:hypothetical protein
VEIIPMHAKDWPGWTDRVYWTVAGEPERLDIDDFDDTDDHDTDDDHEHDDFDDDPRYLEEPPFDVDPTAGEGDLYPDGPDGDDIPF